MNRNPLLILEDIIQSSGSRSEELLTTFPDGFAAGWKMQIPAVFADCLDITLTDKTIQGTKQKVLTQGCQFRFKEGDLMYDVRESSIPAWEDAVRHINLGVQVVKARPATSGVDRDPGLVEFSVYRPNKNRTGLELEKKLTSTQDGFIRFLLTGTL